MHLPCRLFQPVQLTEQNWVDQRTQAMYPLATAEGAFILQLMLPRAFDLGWCSFAAIIPVFKATFPEKFSTIKELWSCW